MWWISNARGAVMWACTAPRLMLVSDTLGAIFEP
jgi:hypothetical protein